MKNIFTHHPETVGETYFEHLKFALGFGVKMLVGGLACIIHAIFPFLFQKTGSDFLLKLTSQFIERTSVSEKRAHTLLKLIEERINKNKFT